jgi:hypothetical protein
VRRCRVLAESRRSCPRRTTFQRFAAKGLSRISFALAVADHVLTAIRPPNSIAAKQFETCPDMIGVAQPAAPASGVLDHAKRRSVGVAVRRRAEPPRGWTASAVTAADTNRSADRRPRRTFSNLSRWFDGCSGPPAALHVEDEVPALQEAARLLSAADGVPALRTPDLRIKRQAAQILRSGTDSTPPPLAIRNRVPLNVHARAN